LSVGVSGNTHFEIERLDWHIAEKLPPQPIKFEPLATGATRSIAVGIFRLRRTLRRLPMKSSFRLFADPHAMLRRNCVSQVMISLSALASTAIVLIQVVPTILSRLQ
jgi:hypothetical protein